jgi:TolB-like protein
VAVVLALAAIVGVSALGARFYFARPANRINSIAVLPLENLSHDPEQEYFADGMTDALITDLSKIGSLRIISRTSAMHYKGINKTVPEIAKELNVDGIVEGSVMRSGNRVRITAQLIQARTDQHLWAESYERDLRDVLVLQSDVAQAVANEIKIKLTPQEQIQLRRRRPVDPEAYQLYLKGRYYWNRRTEEGFHRAIEYFSGAIEKDPNYALAYAGLADCYNLLGVFGYVPPRDAYPRGKAAATKALELDEELAEAHASLARNKIAFGWDWSGARREFERALELNPNYATAHYWYSYYYFAMGRLDADEVCCWLPNNSDWQWRPAATSFIAQHAMFEIRVSSRGTCFASKRILR